MTPAVVSFLAPSCSRGLSSTKPQSGEKPNCLMTSSTALSDSMLPSSHPLTDCTLWPLAAGDSFGTGPIEQQGYRALLSRTCLRPAAVWKCHNLSAVCCCLNCKLCVSGGLWLYMVPYLDERCQVNISLSVPLSVLHN